MEAAIAVSTALLSLITVIMGAIYRELSKLTRELSTFDKRIYAIEYHLKATDRNSRRSIHPGVDDKETA